uniref:Ethylene receptor n=1 Tax=Kalanchoe fedtschenkoi TaxID=63787 RepID=A0A7N0UE24_KALFE
MWNKVALGLFIWMHLSTSVSATEGRCMCDIEGFWRAENIFECQRVSDLLIAVAYFSIPIELLYFVSCSNVPFKWVLSQFIAFIVLCGMTHLLNAWTYAPHSFRLMLAVTVFKFLTALVSFATAITLFTIFPLLLKIKRREIMLRKKTWDLDREVGLIKRRKETGWHVRMLTQEIRKSLDKHTILYTTLVELSETLDLKNCAVWMPNEERTKMNLTHELKGRNFHNQTVPITDPDVVQIKRSDGVNILSTDSALGAASSGGGAGDAGPIAAIRMPMLRVSDFKGGTPEMIKTCYAILVLVLPNKPGRSWTKQELEIVEVVADQVAVALSHAAVLEESQLMREKLVEQNRALLQAKKDAMMANQARNSFQKVLSTSMRRPMHSISGLLSMLQDEKMSNDQRIIVDAISKSNEVLSTLVNDLMDVSFKKNGPFSLNTRTFRLHSLIKEAACLLKCLCAYWGFDFSVDVERSLPDLVTGDERRIFQIIMHMFGSIIHSSNGNGAIAFRIFSETGSNNSDQKWATWRSNLPDGYVNIRFEIDFNNYASQLEARSSIVSGPSVGRLANDKVSEGLSFVICKKIVQLMQGNIWAVPSPQGYDRSMALTLRLHLKQSLRRSLSDIADHPHSNSLFKGLQILVADDDDVNRAVTRKLLEKLGCSVSVVSSGFECLSAVGLAASPFQIILLDLHMTDLDGYELALRIRKFQSHNWPLIIALTAVSDEEDVWERCMQTGINGVIRKPVSAKGISDELRRVLVQTNMAMP